MKRKKKEGPKVPWEELDRANAEYDGQAERALESHIRWRAIRDKPLPKVEKPGQSLGSLARRLRKRIRRI